VSGASAWRRRTPALLLFGVLLLTIWAYREVPQLGFSDIDGATLLRVTRLGDDRSLVDVLGSEFRADPRHGIGFYRPLTSLSYAVQQVLWPGRLGPLHAFDLLLHLGCVVALFALARALSLSQAAALLAASFVALHPLAAEVVPSIARRGESLAMLCLTLALWAERRGRHRLALACGILAPLAKESGFLIALLPLAGGEDRIVRRGARALACILPGLLLRLWVLGSLGGYADAPGFVAPAAARAWLDLLDPQRLLGMWGARLLGLLVMGALLWRWRQGAVRLGLTWCAAALALSSLAGGLSPWYLYAALFGPALALGSMLGDRRPWLRGLAVVAGLSAVGASPVWIDYPEWREASRWQERFVAALEDRCASGELTEASIALAGIPLAQGQGPSARFHLRGAHIALGWTLRDALFWRSGRQVEIYGAAPVRVHAIGAAYRIETQPTPDGVRLWPVGPVRLAATDLGTERLGGRELPFLALASADTVEVSALRVPLWTWDGSKLLRYREID
jgi:hypothetical protein